MSRWLPFPLLWLALLAMWLLLNQTLALGDVILGALVAGVACLALNALQTPRAGLRRPYIAAELGFLVLADIVRSNIAVARIVMHLGTRNQTSAFVQIPLELRSPEGLAVLTCIITSNPGTVWSRYDSTDGMLTMHVLDLIDENAWIVTIKHRYERRLLEIFP